MPRVDAEYVKAAITPLDFYRRELPSMPEPRHPGGWVSGGLCVFHLDRHPKNFRINMDSGAFTCFSCGAAGGDVIAFMMQHYGLSFHDALRRLANEWRIS
jgi:DNA primase